MTEPILRVTNLCVSFGSRAILRELSFEVQPGDCLAVIGPNGSGKTVVLKALLNLIPYRGEIRWSPDTRLGYVPQRIAEDRQLPLRVRELLMAKVHVQKLLVPELDQVCSELGLTREILDGAIGTLSGGQFQKVLIALSLLGRPNVLLFDEPTASLDELSEERIYELLHSLQQARELTVVLVTHELSVVYRYATQVLCLSREKACMGRPTEVLTPERLAELHGSPSRSHRHVHDLRAS